MSGSTFARSVVAAVAMVAVSGQAAAAGPARQEETQELRNTGKSNWCVEPAGSTVRTAPCSGQAGQLWTWDLDTGLLRSNAGPCLAAHADKPLALEPCDTGNLDQSWAYYAKVEVFEIDKQPRALTAHQESSAVTAEPWKEGNTYQQWGEW